MSSHKVLNLVTVAAMTTVGLVAIPVPAWADPVPTPKWTAALPTSQSDINILTQPDGGVSVGCEGLSGPAIRSFDAAGAMTQQLNQTDPRIKMCDSWSAVGADGTVYAVAQSGSYAFDAKALKAYRANQAVWSYSAPCGGYFYSITATASAVYALASGMQSPCTNYSAVIGLSSKPLAGETEPQRLSETPVVGDMGVLAVFQGGFVIANASRHQYYVGSVPQPAVNIPREIEGFAAAHDSGRIFLAVSGSIAERNACGGKAVTTRIDAYEPSGSKWSYALPSCTKAVVSPAPGGGAIAKTWNVVSSYGTTFSLTAISSSGVFRWSRPIYTQPSSGESLYLSVVADLGGNIAVQGKLSVSKTIGGNSRTFPSAWFVLYNGMTGAEIDGSRVTLWGDGTTTTGPSYMLLNWRHVAIAKDTVYMAAITCTSLPTPCDNAGAKLYAYNVPGLAMDYPRGALLDVTPSPTSYKLVEWLGDSYSAGVGAGDYYPQTTVGADQDNYNECYRSRNAYSRVLTADKRLALRDGGFWACTGAETKHVVDTTQYGPYSQPPQSMFLTPSVDYVVMTMGGNDIGFGDVAKACLMSSCAGQAYKDALNKISTVLPGNMATMFDAIRSNVKPQTRVLIVSYPMMVNAPTSTKPNCSVMDRNEMIAVRDIITKLNTGLGQAVKAANAKSGSGGTQFQLIDANKTGSPFKGHELCTSNPAFNALKLASGSVSAMAVESFHPNKLGHGYYAQIVRPYLPAV